MDTLCVSELPEDILLRVLYFVTIQPGNHMRNWKDTFPTISVCKHWRQIALRMVYSSAFIEFSGHESEVFDEYGHMIGMRSWSKVKTNIELIIANGYAHFVRALFINITMVPDHLACLKKLPGILHLGELNWSRISQLKLKFYDKKNEVDEADDDDSDETQEIAQQFICHIPNISKLQLTCYTDLAANSMFSNRIMDAYTTQLKWYYGETILPNSTLNPSTQLTYMCLHSVNTQMLNAGCVSALSLRHLELYDVPYSFEWNYFYQPGNNKRMVFKELVQLNITYDTGDFGNRIPTSTTMQAQSQVLTFPKLQYLEVNHTLCNCPVLFHAQLPPTLQVLTISCSLYCARALSEYTLPALQHATLLIYDELPEPGDSQVEPINKLLAQIQAQRGVKLKYHSKFFAGDINKMEWSSLKHLHISTQIDAGMLVQLLCQIPNIEELHISDLGSPQQDTGDLLTQLKDSNLGDMDNMELRLKSLEIDYVDPYKVYKLVPLLRHVAEIASNLRSIKVNSGEVTRATIVKRSDARLCYYFYGK